jgi:hypothetical protein
VEDLSWAPSKHGLAGSSSIDGGVATLVTIKGNRRIWPMRSDSPKSSRGQGFASQLTLESVRLPMSAFTYARGAWPAGRLQDNFITAKPAQSMSQLAGSGTGEV